VAAIDGIHGIRLIFRLELWPHAMLALHQKKIITSQNLTFDKNPKHYHQKHYIHSKLKTFNVAAIISSLNLKTYILNSEV